MGSFGSVINPYLSEEEYKEERYKMRQDGKDPDIVGNGRKIVNQGVSKGVLAGSVATALGIGSVMLGKKIGNSISEATLNLKQTQEILKKTVK